MLTPLQLLSRLWAGRKARTADAGPTPSPHPLGDRRIPLCEDCDGNQGTHRLPPPDGRLVCQDCHEDFEEAR